MDGNNRLILEDSQNSDFDVHWELSMKELEAPFSLENDSNIEKAEACCKELADVSIYYFCCFKKKKWKKKKNLKLSWCSSPVVPVLNSQYIFYTVPQLLFQISLKISDNKKL